MADYVDKYLMQLQQTLGILPVDRIHQVIEWLHQARIERRKIFIMGNGGSASTASHFVADLGKNTRHENWPDFRVIGLADNMAIFSAYANDEGYENVFANQLASFIEPKDVVIAISTSGNSANVLKAVELAERVGARTIGFTGFDGGKLGRMVDVHLHVPSNIIEQVEDVHLVLEHLITKVLRERAQTAIEPAAMQQKAYPLRSNGHKPMTGHPSLEKLYAVSREMSNGEQSTYGWLQETLQLSLESLGAASGSIMILNEEGEIVHALIAYGDTIKVLNTKELADFLRDGLAGWVVQNREGALVANTQYDSRWVRRDWEAGENSPRSVISVPLLDRDRVAGVLTLAQRSAGEFNHSHLVMLAAIGAFASYRANGALASVDGN